MSKLYWVECSFPGSGKLSDSRHIAVLFQLMHASSTSSLSIERRFRATMWAKVPQTKAGIADFNRRWWTELGSP
jgi:hypothetical protein